MAAMASLLLRAVLTATEPGMAYSETLMELR